MSVASRARRVSAKRRLSAQPFDQRLVLNRFLLQLFGVDSLQELARDLKDPNYELLDEENVSQFHHLLVARFPELGARPLPGPSLDDLRRYDDNIVRHTLAIGAHRGEQIRWKYFQYLALLFTELYLDRYFSDPTALLNQLNGFVAQLNRGELARGPIDPYTSADLRKLAFWMATGSGKTLVMHINIYQFLHYLKRHDRRGDINRIILITPNEGLSNQHLEEFNKSGLPAELFTKASSNSDLLSGHLIEILDIHKLAEESGEKTVAVDAFEQNNLVLVDEGHRGAGGVDWKDKRDRLSVDGFSFEYSATFGQAIKAANDEDLAQEYAHAILFDYSYRYFYSDGYGKDYQVLNLADDHVDTEHLYLTAALLSFYQQMRVFEEQREQLRPYYIERPLWVFVGGSVTQSLGRAEGTDIHRILSFLARFARERTESVALLARLLSGDTGLASGGHDVFADKFQYLYGLGLSDEQVFDDILRRVFNAPHSAHLRIEELTGADGELAVRLGDAEPFGVINIGDARGLAKLLGQDAHLDVTQREVGRSIFTSLANPDSCVNVLIGSRKFTEGWNSYRVASLGLMNVGKSEGAQIIQLFGRGVRLRGFDGSLKRSSAMPGVQRSDALRLLETLSIYGIRADYMAQFKQFLVEEGLPTNDDVTEVLIPVRRSVLERALKTIRMRGDAEFVRDGPRITLGLPPADFVTRPIPLDCTPKVQVMLSSGLGSLTTTAVQDETYFEPAHLAFLDFDQLYIDLVSYKEQRGWANLTLSPGAVRQVLADNRWYRLVAPTGLLSFAGPEPLRRVPVWQELALSLLKKYVERYYKREREAYEAPLREYTVLTEDDANLIDQYHVTVRQAQQHFLPVLQQIVEQVQSGSFRERTFNYLQVLWFEPHLYNPLVHLGTKDLEITPVPLNEGERDFVADLKAFYERNPAFFEGTEMYLLRNLTRGKGIGFFEAGNFYPDFILWLLAGDRQYITFIDPKGILRLQGPDDPKIAFFDTIKRIEREMNDPHVTLNSFIVSNTRYVAVTSWGLSKEELEQRHVLFQIDDRDRYIEAMLRQITSAHS